MTRPSLIPGSLTVEGELTGRGDLVVMGRVLGDIVIDGLLIIEEGGAVRGEVRASSVIVRGVLVGDAVGQESVRLEAAAQVVGDLCAPRVKVADGAQLKGRVQIGPEARVSSRPSAAPGPRVRRVRSGTPADGSTETPVSASYVPPMPAIPREPFTRPVLSMPRLTRVTAERR